MSSPLPRGFLDINSALSRLNVVVNLMGVVTDFLPPGPSRGTDLMSSFSIADPSYGGTYDDGLKVRFFRRLASEMPAISGTGDVVLLRDIKIMAWSGMTIGLSTQRTSWVVFPAGSIPEKAPAAAGLQLRNVKEARSLAPTIAEMHYAISLCNSRDRTTFTVPSSSPTGSAVTPMSSNATLTVQRKDKFSLVKDVNVDTYYNLVGQVVKLYPSNGRVELYLTDYTRHCLVWDYPEPDDGNGYGREGDEYNYTASKSSNKKWNGPYGKMTLTVTLWGNNAYFAQQNIKENDFVHLRNVHIKFSRDVKVEGAIHEDRRYPDRVDVTFLKGNDDDRVKDVLRRKRDYWKKINNRQEGSAHQTKALKRKSVEDLKILSKNQARRKRKQESKQLERSKDQGEEDESDKENDVGKNTCRHSNKRQKLDHGSSSLKQELNNNVRCAHHLINPRPISSIISLDKHTNTPPNGAPYILPFQNINSRATVRVIDFFPPKLVDFTVRRSRPSEYDILSDDECSESGSDQSTNDPDDGSETENGQWEWRFGLVLEDALSAKKQQQERATVEVYVTGQDAEGLLQLEAENLRKTPAALDTLREKLFLLWGDLEEQKARCATSLQQVNGNAASAKKIEAPKMKPFQCCLKEYGVKKKIQRILDEDAGETEDESGSERKDRTDWVWERRWRMFGCTIS